MNHSAPGSSASASAPSGRSARPHRADDAVAADAEVTVGEERQLVGVEVDLAVRVGEQHEVVAGAVALGEVESVRHRQRIVGRELPGVHAVGRRPASIQWVSR